MDFLHTENGRSALHYAATLDEPEGTEIANFLLEQGCDINKADEDQNTPLIWAINYNQLDMVKFLLNKGASVDSSVTQYGHNPILECVHVAHLMQMPSDEVLDMMGVFVDKGSDVNAMDQDQSTALHWASRFGLAELSRYLLSNGADGNVTNNEGKTPADLADADDVKSCFVTASTGTGTT